MTAASSAKASYLEPQAGSLKIARLLSLAETSEMFGIPKATLYKWTHRKEVPHYKLGRTVKFNADEFLAWLETRKVVS